MSKNLSAVAVIEFDSMVKHAYQGMGLLKGTVNRKKQRCRRYLQIPSYGKRSC
jgi:hypothetical protein